MLSGVSHSFAGDVFLREVAPGAWAHFGHVSLTTPDDGGDIANLGVVVGRDAVAVIDTGGSLRVGQELLTAIGRLTAKPVRYVINTHEHPDHVFGNAAFASPGITFVGHHALPEAMAARWDHYLKSFRDSLGAPAIAQVRMIAPTVLVTDSMTLDLGERPLRLTAWRTAHTDCDLTVLDESSGTLFSGDVVFLDHTPVVDGSLLGWQAILPVLAAIPARRVVPGHGRGVAPWPEALDAERRYFGVLASDARRMIARGITLAAAVPQIGEAERGQWALFDDYNPRNATVAYTELEWE